MIPSELERLVKEAFEQKKRPFFVNCTCGTTVLGKYSIYYIAFYSTKFVLHTRRVVRMARLQLF